MLRRILPNRTTDRVKDWLLWRWMEINGRKEGVEYLLRLYVINTPWFGIKIHWFKAPDPDEHCHDHPWWFFSFLLKGSYQEQRQSFVPVGQSYMLTENTERTRRRFSWAFRRATDVHRITRCTKECVTLVINGPKQKSWAFWAVNPERIIPLGYFGNLDAYRPVPWREYLGIPEETPGV